RRRRGRREGRNGCRRRSRLAARPGELHPGHPASARRPRGLRLVLLNPVGSRLMLVLIANLGSTSFKYRLFEMTDEGGRVLAKGGYERVSAHGEVIEGALVELETGGAVASRDEIGAVGFKTVLGRNLSGCVDADERVLEALEGFAAVAP